MISYSVVWRILCSCFFGSIIFFYNIENDSSFKKFVEQQLREIFLKTFECHLEGTVKRIHILGGTIELQDVSTYALDRKAWQWAAKKFNLSFSWIDVFLTWQFNLKVNLEGLYAKSELKGSDIGILDHLRRLIGGAPGFPAGLKKLLVTKGNFALHDNERAIEYVTQFMLQTKMINQTIEINLFGTQGSLKKNADIFCQDWICGANIVIKNSNNPTITAQLQGDVQLPDLEKTMQSCSYNGTWANNAGNFSFYNIDHSLFIAVPSIVMSNKKDISAEMNLIIPLAIIKKQLPFTSLALQGVGKMTAQIHYADQLHMNGDLRVENLNYNFCNLGNLSISFANQKDVWWGNILAGMEKNQQPLQGVWSFSSEEGAGSIEMSTTATIKIPWLPYSIPPQAAKLFMDFSTSGSCAVSYEAKAVDEHHNQALALQGILCGSDKHYKAEGNINVYPYIFDINLIPSEALLEFSCRDNQKTLFSFATKKQKMNQFDGMIDYQVFQNYSESCLAQKIPGQGKLLFSGIGDPEMIAMKFATRESNIRIPGTYNLLRDMQGQITIELPKRKLSLSEVKLELDRGMITCKNAVAYFDNNNSIDFMHVPCLIQRTLISLHKDLFALVSGYLIFSQEKNDAPAMMRGSIIIDRAHIKKNIFSFATPHNNAFFTHNSSFFQGQDQCNLDLSLQTKDSLQIKTSFLDASAKINMNVKGTIQNPHISGSVTVDRGVLAFPYKPLTITNASIYFLPNQLSDPMVELVAKGTIRKYHITMRCNGSLKNPHISFESTPSLTEEQIITLLLAGSEEGSLSLVMPSVLMQSMKNVLFGPEQSPSKLDRYFKNLLGPLKHIRFVPKFFDPQGRGGFRGAIEIDVNDQLHGVIQRNFSLPEDIKLEVEYFFSDDIAVRGIRDERGDLGGEIEMRWKF